jgi:hypothetical protein
VHSEFIAGGVDGDGDGDDDDDDDDDDELTCGRLTQLMFGSVDNYS